MKPRFPLGVLHPKSARSAVGSLLWFHPRPSDGLMHTRLPPQPFLKRADLTVAAVWSGSNHRRHREPDEPPEMQIRFPIRLRGQLRQVTDEQYAKVKRG